MSSVSFDTLTMVRLGSPSQFIPDPPGERAVSLGVHNNGLQRNAAQGWVGASPYGQTLEGSVPPSLQQLFMLHGQLMST